MRRLLCCILLAGVPAQALAAGGFGAGPRFGSTAHSVNTSLRLRLNQVSRVVQVRPRPTAPLFKAFRTAPVPPPQGPARGRPATGRLRGLLRSGRIERDRMKPIHDTIKRNLCRPGSTLAVCR